MEKGAPFVPSSVFVHQVELIHRLDLQNAAQIFGRQLQYLPADQIPHALTEHDVLITDEFSGELFTQLRKKRIIISPHIFIQLANSSSDFPRLKRPLFNHALKDRVILFSGYGKAEEESLSRLTQLVHHMDGLVRPDFAKSGSSQQVTQVVVRRVNSEKYHYAVSMEIDVVKEQWILDAWEHRNEGDVSRWTDPKNYIANPFIGLKLYLSGFKDAELLMAKEQAIHHEGEVVDNFADATHIIVDDANAGEIKVTSEELSGVRFLTVTRADDFSETFQLTPGQVVVRSEWFWSSIKIGACAEPTPYSLLSPDLFSALKKKDLRFNLTSPRNLSTPTNVRLSSVEESQHSFASLDRSDDSLNVPSSESIPTVSKRYQTVMEMLDTERNYVRILAGIRKIVESAGAEPPNGPLLPEGELDQLRTYFAKLSDIHEIHVLICHELTKATSPWSDDALIGRIWLQYCPRLELAYPPFVNVFEEIRSFIQICEKNYPRFNAMLMLSQKNPEYGRQNLKELIIRPVQRLPSVQLLLRDLQRRTKESLPDYADLGLATLQIDKVLTLVNEKKREAEYLGLLVSIENLPEDVRARHRSLMYRVDCVELADNQWHSLGARLIFMLYNDFMEVAKIRQHPMTENKKPLKHLKLLPLKEITSIVDVMDFEDTVRGAFVLYISKDDGEQMYKFALAGDHVNKKAEFLRALAKEVAIAKCSPDANSLIQKMAGGDVGIDSTEVVKSTPWEKACKLQRNLSKRITSMGKRSGQKLKRAMSSAFLSPANRLQGLDKDDPDGASPKKIFRR